MDYQILIIFYQNISDTTGHQMLFYFIFSLHRLSVSALPEENGTSKILHYFQYGMIILFKHKHTKINRS